MEELLLYKNFKCQWTWTCCTHSYSTLSLADESNKRRKTHEIVTIWLRILRNNNNKTNHFFVMEIENCCHIVCSGIVNCQLYIMFEIPSFCSTENFNQLKWLGSCPSIGHILWTCVLWNLELCERGKCLCLSLIYCTMTFIIVLWTEKFTAIADRRKSISIWKKNHNNK